MNILVFGTKYIVFSLLSFFVSQQILIVYGSSVNGVVAAATQIMALLFILEGGFTTATVTALYKPYVEQDYTEYNIIISTTCKAFRKIACLTLLIGLPVSFLYPLFLKTELSYIKCSIIFGLICFTTAINFYFFQVRQIMFHVAQKEFIPQTIAMICTSVAQLLMVLVIFLKQDILIVRGVVALMLTISGISVCLLAKRFFFVC